MAQDLLNRVNEHINAVANDPSTPLNARLFEEAELVLTERGSVSTKDEQVLVTSVSSLLVSLQQDPTPAVNLLLRLIRSWSYSKILETGNIPFVDGLAVGEHMVAYNRLILSILGKATKNAADAASVAGMLDAVLALVRLWLCTSDTGITNQASQLLLDLLKVDQEIVIALDAHVPSRGQGLMWKRLFGDRDVYRMLLEPCSPNDPQLLKISKSQSTLAQSRFLKWLPEVASMNWSTVARSHHPDIEAAYNFKGGLLDFAVLRISEDLKDDVLMHRCLIDFYSDILLATKPSVGLSGSVSDSEGLRYLITHGVHAQTAALFLQVPGVQVDPLDATFLYGPAANYIATYASQYPEHFLASQLPKQVLERLSATLDLSPARWAHTESPKHDLHVLASLPRRALLPITGNGSWSSSPLSLLPSKSTNADVLNTLAVIFHGPDQDIKVYPGTDISQPSDPRLQEEAAEACALYYNYIAANPRFWNDIARHADTVALKDLALAAIGCLISVITAHWTEQAEVLLPTSIATPAKGHLAILTPPALEYALPYLLKPPQTFANLVGGRGDAESAAYKIASAKFDALQAFHSRLVTQAEEQPGQGYEEILATVQKRLIEGPLSREGEVGGRIGTMEL